MVGWEWEMKMDITAHGIDSPHLCQLQIFFSPKKNLSLDPLPTSGDQRCVLYEFLYEGKEGIEGNVIVR